MSQLAFTSLLAKKVTIDYDPKKHFFGSSYNDVKEDDEERQNAGHNGLVGTLLILGKLTLNGNVIPVMVKIYLMPKALIMLL